MELLPQGKGFFFCPDVSSFSLRLEMLQKSKWTRSALLDISTTTLKHSVLLLLLLKTLHIVLIRSYDPASLSLRDLQSFHKLKHLNHSGLGKSYKRMPCEQTKCMPAGTQCKSHL